MIMLSETYGCGDGTFCPCCGSKNIDRGNHYISGHTAYHGVSCLSCSASWWSVFKLSGYQNLVPNSSCIPITQHTTDFYSFTVVVHERLGGEGVDNVASIVGYAFRALAGEPCDLTGSAHVNTTTEISISWDSTKSGSDDIGARLPEVIENLKTYLEHGTPIRTTNRAGEGTKGTRLVESMGFALIGVYVTEE